MWYIQLNKYGYFLLDNAACLSMLTEAQLERILSNDNPILMFYALWNTLKLQLSFEEAVILVEAMNIDSSSSGISNLHKFKENKT